MDKTHISMVGATLLVALAGCSLFEPSVDVHPKLVINGQPINGADEQFEKGRKLLAEGRFGPAAQAFQAALTAGPPTVERLNGLAVAYDHLGRFELSDEYYRRALSLDARSAQTLNNLGVSFARRGMPERAALVLAEAARAEPTNETVAANLVAARAETAGGPQAPSNARDVAQLPVPEQQPVPRVERVGVGALELVTGPSMDVPTPMAEVVPPRHPIVALEIASAPAAVTAAIPDLVRAPPLAPGESPREVAEVRAQRGVATAAAPPSDIARAKPVVVAAVVPRAKERAAVTRVRSPRIEVANGAGRTRMATRMRGYLSGRGVSVARVTNDQSFGHASTVIYYRPGYEESARQLSQSLPVQIETVMSETLASDVRIRLGRDLIAFDTGLQTGRRNEG